jgi:hypothetical protein
MTSSPRDALDEISQALRTANEEFEQAEKKHDASSMLRIIAQQAILISFLKTATAVMERHVIELRKLAVEKAHS